VEATLATMVDDTYVNHILVITGGYNTDTDLLYRWRDSTGG
jgi:hypothetical protein